VGKVTSKLQVTVPKAIADTYRIKPGDEILWVPAGDSIRVQVRKTEPPARSVASNLRLFDVATARQRARNAQVAASAKGASRGWTREELYDRGRSR
jgi:bifunctional DNA-binding transcriptional regulator/antitoxin component of YhaV-PrlF toxin-antitoxin module